MSVHLIHTNAPNRTVARKLVRKLLGQKLAACAHIFPAGESLYWWKGRLETSREVAILFKTSKKALPSLIQNLKKSHPYETPEILAVRVVSGHPTYLNWVNRETKDF